MRSRGSSKRVGRGFESFLMVVEGESGEPEGSERRPAAKQVEGRPLGRGVPKLSIASSELVAGDERLENDSGTKAMEKGSCADADCPVKAAACDSYARLALGRREDKDVAHAIVADACRRVLAVRPDLSADAAEKRGEQRRSGRSHRAAEGKKGRTGLADR